MTDFGAAIAIMENGRVLLTQREDFEVWCLPGGHTDPGESVAETARREALEETGLEVELTRLVGLYARTGALQGHVALFAARVVGGTIAPQPDEVIDIGYFAPDAIPDDLLWWHRQMIHDACSGVRGAAWTAHVEQPDRTESRAELYAKRDESGLSRVEFYRAYFEGAGNYTRQELIEVAAFE